MNNNQNGSAPKQEKEQRTSEAELFAEILSRMDAKQEEAAQTEAEKAPKTIDLVELFYYMLSKLHFILLGMIIGAVVLGMYASIGWCPFIPPRPSCIFWATQVPASWPTCKSARR